MTQIGLRAIGSARQREVEAARAFGSHLFVAEQIHAEGMDTVLATIPEGRPVYLTIDADGLDPTEMPAVMAPTPEAYTSGSLRRSSAPSRGETGSSAWTSSRSRRPTTLRTG